VAKNAQYKIMTCYIVVWKQKVFHFLCSCRVWTQGLHLEPLHQSFSRDGSFRDRVLQIICLHWIWTMILLISVSWVARTTGMSHHCPTLKTEDLSTDLSTFYWLHLFTVLEHVLSSCLPVSLVHLYCTHSFIHQILLITYSMSDTSLSPYYVKDIYDSSFKYITSYLLHSGNTIPRKQRKYINEIEY
jgi:hypothetical protein